VIFCYLHLEPVNSRKWYWKYLRGILVRHSLNVTSCILAWEEQLRDVTFWVVGHESRQRKRESLCSNGFWRRLAVGEKPVQWSVIGQGERLPASSQLYPTSQSLWDKLIFRSCWLSKEISHILWSQRIYYCVYKNVLLVPIINHMNPACNSRPSFSILTLLSHLYLCLLSGLFPSGFSTETFYAFLFSCSCCVTT
jgi:hypothetical protein